MLISLIIIASISQILVALFVISRDRRNLSNVLFFLISMATLCWALSNYLTITILGSPNVLYVVRMILFFVVIQNTFFYMFARTFPADHWKHSKVWLAVYIGFSVVTAITTISPFVFTSVGVQDGLAVTQAGPAILIFIAHASISIIFAFKSLVKKVRESSGPRKRQFEILLIASLLTWIIVPITNFVLTPLLKTTIFIELGPLYSLAFASLIAYAIVAQNMFDIKRTVARSVAYILSLGFIGLIYGLMIFILSFFLASDSRFDSIDRVIYILLALVSAVLYAPIKKFFDKLTNRIFFQDAYDAQKFLDQLNKTIVADIELSVLLRHTTEVIQQNLKAEFCTVEVLVDGSGSEHEIGTTMLNMDKKDNQFLIDSISNLGQKILLTDGIEDKNNKLKKILLSKDIGIVARLTPGNLPPNQSVAYLFIGSKKSGNSYNKQDVMVLEIITDQMLIAIQNALRFEEIQGFAARLQKEVNEATAKLQNSNRKLLALDETKDEFISMASHQLRTPLTSVKGYMSMVLEGDAGKLNKQQEKLLNQAFVSSQRMVYLIADLLNVSRLKAGNFIIDRKPVNLSEIVESEISQLIQTAKTKNMKLIYNKSKPFPDLMLDETKIRQVIMNFADNAIFYTPNGGKIMLELKEDKNNIYFTVQDSGMGVPASERGKIFTKFYRATNAKKARPDGTGLGLFMAKKAVEAQGGSLIFHSVEGKGSTFGFTFNKKKLAVKPS